MKRAARIIMTACMLATAAAANAQLVKIKEMITVAEDSVKANATEVVINAQFCKVNISEYDGDASVSGKLEALEDHDGYKVNIAAEGQTITASIEVPTDAKSSYAGEFSVRVPKNVSVKIVAGSGNTVVSNMSAANVNITSVKGKVTAKRVMGTLSATTENGSVTLTDIDGNFSVSTNTGKVTATNVKGTLTFDTADGDAAVTNLDGILNGKTIAGTQTYDNIKSSAMKLQGSTGAVKISKSDVVLTANLKGATLNFHCVAGEFHITSERGSIISAASINGITLRASSDFTTTEGKVNLTFTNKKDELRFDLEHAQKGEIGLIAKGERTTKKQLKCGSGPILITGRTNTGTQTYK